MPRRSRFIRSAPLALLILVGGFVLAWTWLGWPDPIVDFGREAYVPWQLTQGKLLYRDIAYLNGPLSPYFNAIVFKILGVSIHSLMLVNGAIAIGVIAMIWKLFRIAGGTLSATIACLTFELLFMSTQFVGIGNYNWLCPYSHEVTHGVALGLASLLTTIGFIERPTKMRAGVVGLCVGLCILTKPEIAVATGIAASAGMILATRAQQLPRRARLESIASFFVAAILPVIIATILFSMKFPIGEALRATFGGWIHALDRRVTTLYFYKLNSGLDDPRGNATRAVMQMLAYLLALGPAWLIDLTIRRRNVSSRTSTGIAIAYAAVLVVVLSLAKLQIPWNDAFRGLFPAMVIASFIVLIRVVRAGGLVPPRVIAQTMLTIFATLLLLKLLLAVHLFHYGFALAMPALLVLAAIGINWLSCSSTNLSASGESKAGVCTLKAATIAALCVTIFMYLRAYSRFYSERPIAIAEGTADEFRPPTRATVVNDVIAFLDQLPPDQTLATIPQGVMFNYLSRRTNPTPFVSLFPLEVTLFGGDDKIAESYAAHPPDWVLVVQSDLRGEGFHSLDEYAPVCSGWLHENYSPVRAFGGGIDPTVTLLAKRAR